MKAGESDSDRIRPFTTPSAGAVVNRYRIIEKVVLDYCGLRSYHCEEDGKL